MNNNDIINIVPIVSEISSNDGSIINRFDNLTIKKNTSGEFAITFLVNAMIEKRYFLSFLVFKINNNLKKLVMSDSVIIPPKSGYEYVNTKWQLSKGELIVGTHIEHISYNNLSESSEYCVAAFYRQINDDVKIEDIKFEEMILACETHFWVKIE